MTNNQIIRKVFEEFAYENYSVPEYEGDFSDWPNTQTVICKLCQTVGFTSRDKQIKHLNTEHKKEYKEMKNG